MHLDIIINHQEFVKVINKYEIVAITDTMNNVNFFPELFVNGF